MLTHYGVTPDNFRAVFLTHMSTDTPGKFMVVPDFFPQAENLRLAIDQHFSTPHEHRPETHQIWNYWYVSETYTYFRTMPNKIFSYEMLYAFMMHLESWSRSNLNCVPTYPYLSLYVDGCKQEIHNDALAGSYGYVYSLTRWQARSFTGGETLLMKGDAYDRSMAGTEAMAGWSFFEMVPAEFNQLLVFDDRIPHAVRRVEGGMNPLEGRLVMHGHLSPAE